MIVWPEAHTLVDRHFGGTTSATSDRRLWRHLRRCEACRQRYRAHALLEALDPAGEATARERLGRTVFRRRAARVWFPVLALAVAGSVAALALIPGRADDGFRARGGAAPAREPALVVFRVPPGGAPERVGTRVRPEDALAFAYLNPSDATHLMVFGRDDGGRVYWYAPVWQDATATPASIAIASGVTPLEVGDAVQHPLAPGLLTITALFSRRPHRVTEVEAALQAGSAGLIALDKEARIWTLRLEVAP